MREPERNPSNEVCPIVQPPSPRHERGRGRDERPDSRVARRVASNCRGCTPRKWLPLRPSSAKSPASSSFARPGNSARISDEVTSATSTASPPGAARRAISRRCPASNAALASASWRWSLPSEYAAVSRIWLNMQVDATRSNPPGKTTAVRDAGQAAIASKSAGSSSEFGVRFDRMPSVAVTSTPPCSRNRGWLATPCRCTPRESASESISTKCTSRWTDSKAVRSRSFALPAPRTQRRDRRAVASRASAAVRHRRCSTNNSHWSRLVAFMAT